METLCGIDCNGCMYAAECKGCKATDGHPLCESEQCMVAECFLKDGMEGFAAMKQQIMDELNALHVPGMPEVTQLYCLSGWFVNLPYRLDSGAEVKFLNDKRVYLGAQLPGNGDRCYGVVAHRDFLMVCTYGARGADPQLVVYKKR